MSLGLGQNILSVDGWISVNEAWTYSSATVVNIPTGGTSRFQAGDRIKFNNTTTKYFVVIAVAATTLTLFAGTTYTVANSAITAIFISRLASPMSFPKTFDYTTTTALGTGAGTWTPGAQSYFKVSVPPDGNKAEIGMYWVGVQSGAASSYVNFTIPIPSASPGGSHNQYHSLYVEENGVIAGGFAVIVGGASTVARLYKGNLGAFTGGGTTFGIGNWSYYI